MQKLTGTINHDTCIRCSRCVNICPKFHLDLIDGKICEIDIPIRSCMYCGHCMSVCPTKSIARGEFDYIDFIDLPDELPGLDDFLVLLKARRSVRQYQPKPVPDELIEKILDAATAAPYGLPPTNVEVVVVNGREKAEEVISGVHDVFKSWIKSFTGSFTKIITRLAMSGKAFRVMESRVLPLVKGILKAGENGKDLLTYGAPAMILFHSFKGSPTGRDNCTIAMTYAMIASEALGLGSCIIGFIPPAINRGPEIKKKLGIPDENEVYGCLVFGWSRVTYNRSIPRIFKSVGWVK